LTFRAWLPGVPGLRPPTLADLDYHLSTLFPPVRPRGWLELPRPPAPALAAADSAFAVPGTPAALRGMS
jgi:gamma-glutamylcysteine synthetase